MICFLKMKYGFSRWVLLGLLTVFFQAGNLLAEEGGFSLAVGPTNIRLKGQGGETQNATVRIWNHGKIKVHVQSELNDIKNIINKDGKLERQFLPPGTSEFSCAKWLIVETPEFDLEPQAFRDINFTLSVPDGIKGTKGAALFFRAVPLDETKQQADEDKPSTSVQLQPRLGVLVFFDVEGSLNRIGELKDLTWEAPTADKPLILRYVFQNTGNADILLTGNFLIMDAKQILAAKGDLSPIRTFPGDKGMAETSWPGLLSPGDYHLIATFELGPDAAQVIVKEIDLVVK